jgi:hypothetical protein
LLHPTWFIVSSSPFGLYQTTVFQKISRKERNRRATRAQEKNNHTKEMLRQEIEATKAKIQFLTTGCTVQRYKVYHPPRTPEEERINNVILWAEELKKKNK